MPIPVPTIAEIKQKLELQETPAHIGTGGFKAVYRITKEAGCVEALKAVHIPESTADDEESFREQLIARAKREVKALGECRSPNLVKLGSIPAQLRQLGNSDYLVYSEEYLEGMPLSDRIRNGYVPDFFELKKLFITLIELIQELNTIGYLHRDIKPENIMDRETEDRRYVMLDLGIAYKMHGTQLTQGNSPPGTLRYMAPELLRPDYKDTMDFRCDLYAAGLTIYVFASGTHPFAPQPELQYATIYRIMKTKPEPLFNLRPDLPENFCKIIDRCIRKKPALRYASIDLLKQELQGVDS